MIVAINGSVVRDLPDDGEIELSGAQDEVAGFVFSAVNAADAAASNTLVSAALIFALTFGFGIFLIVAGAGGDRVLRGAGALFLLGSPVVAFIVAAMRQRLWRAAQNRPEALPPAGTKIVFDDEGAVVGERRFPWPQIEVERLDLQRILPGVSDPAFMLARMALRAPGLELTLDPMRLDNGPALLNQAYRKLVSARRPPKAGWF